MFNITYQEKHEVRLEGKLVGEIKAMECDLGSFIGYCFHPKGNKPCGRLFPTLKACKHSVEFGDDIEDLIDEAI